MLFIELDTRPPNALPGNTVRERGVALPFQCGKQVLLALPISMSNNPESQTGKDDSGREYGLNFLGTLKEDALSILEVRDFPPPLISTLGIVEPNKKGGFALSGLFPGRRES